MKEVRALTLNMSYVLSANISSLVISVLIALIVPKIVGVTEYGFWEMYIFYGSYIGLFHLGWADGILLRYGGEDYQNLDATTFKPMGLIYLVGQISLSLLLFLGLLIFQPENIRVFIGVIVLMSVVNLRVYNTFILQAVNRMKDFSAVIFLGNLSFLVGLTLIYFIGITFERLILIDLLSKIISLLYSYYLTSELHTVVIRGSHLRTAFKEVKYNIGAGFPLTVAYIIGLLITGVYRFSIEWQWGVDDFAQVSLALNISSVVLIFISAMAVALYPVLKKIPEQEYASLYSNINYWLTLSLFLLTTFFYIGKPILTMWLPHYEAGISYLTFLFPVFIFESKNVLLNATFLKAKRLERVIVRQNFFTVLVSIILASISIGVFSNLPLAILCVLISNMFVAIIGEVMLGRKFNVMNLKLIFQEIIATIAFILITLKVHPVVAPLLFLVVILFVFRPDTKKTELEKVKFAFNQRKRRISIK